MEISNIADFYQLDVEMFRIEAGSRSISVVTHSIDMKAFPTLERNFRARNGSI